MKKLILTGTHAISILIGFALGIYMLPILTAPPAKNVASLLTMQAGGPRFEAHFSRDRQDSDFFHWGEGVMRFYEDMIVFEGEIAPGPDYRLYLTPRYVETEKDFLAIKEQSRQIAHVKAFNDFALDTSDVLSDTDYNAVVIWCETFGQYISSARLDQTADY